MWGWAQVSLRRRAGWGFWLQARTKEVTRSGLRQAAGSPVGLWGESTEAWRTGSMDNVYQVPPACQPLWAKDQGTGGAGQLWLLPSRSCSWGYVKSQGSGTPCGDRRQSSHCGTHRHMGGSGSHSREERTSGTKPWALQVSSGGMEGGASAGD